MLNLQNINYLNTNQVSNKKRIKPNYSNINFKAEPTSNNGITKNIYPSQSASIYTNNPNQKITHTSWFYINDIHGKMTNMERLYNISIEFDRIKPSELDKMFFKEATDNISKFKVSSGDIILGGNFTHNRVASQFLNWSNFLATALGNHELDVNSPDKLSELLKKSSFPTLAANIDINPNSPLNGQIKKSAIVEKDGIKYGIIGIAPSDLFKRVKMNDTLKDIQVKNTDETINSIKQEIETLQKQGINHIVLLSHAGFKIDQKIAQEVNGIDIIFGAHTHDLVKDIKNGENLFYSPDGNPVIITQAGKDGENCGVLNVDFNQDGIITKVQNNIIKTRDFNRPLFIKDSVEHILGKPEIIGKVGKTLPPPQNRLIENNPHGNLIADAMRSELDTDIALLNSGNIRGNFSVGPIDTRLLYDITPFDDHMMVLSLNEKQIVDAVKFGCKSITKTSMKPGILLVSGLRYTTNKKGELLKLEFIDKNKQTHIIDVNNPDVSKKYTVAADDFFAMGGDGYLETNQNPNFVLKELPYDKDKLADEYIKKMKQPIEIVDDHRINIVD